MIGILALIIELPNAHTDGVPSSLLPFVSDYNLAQFLRARLADHPFDRIQLV